MTHHRFRFLFLALLVVGISFVACDKDDPIAPITGTALFSYVADGFIVTFTNESTVSGTVTYAWDFGDGESSTDKDPVHTFATKGEYDVTLTVSDSQNGTHPISTKVAVDKKTRISLTDNSIDDWAVVTETEFIVPIGDNSGVVTGLKFDYDAEFVYALLTFEGALVDSTRFNVVVDVDADTATGWFTWIWPVLGIDYLHQAQLGLGENSAYGVFNNPSAAGDHGWPAWEDVTPTLPANFYVFGGAYEAGGKVTYEIGFDRAKMPGFDADKIDIGIYLANKGWAEIGFAPDKTEEGGTPQKAFTLEMN